MEDRIDTKTKEAAEQLRALGNRLEAGDDATLHVWVLDQQLACAHRPLRHHPRFGGSARNLSPAATDQVIQWAQTMLASGFVSIICLMHKTELAYYDELALGSDNLLEFYRASGFSVSHIEWEDPAHSKTQPALIARKRNEVRARALDVYDVLPKPTLIHCSAGIQRSAPVAAYIWYKRGL